jgi:sialate O-acetylesterase
MKCIKRMTCLVALLLSAGTLRAEVKCASVFGDHMVLQREASVRFWGTAEPGEQVTVKVGAQTKIAATDAGGKWLISLDPMPAGGPVGVEVQGKNAVKFQDVLIGDVWVCSGQSNMEFPVKRAQDADKDIAAAADPSIRLFSVGRKPSSKPLTSTEGSWAICGPETVPDFSAVGYFFGRDLHKQLGIPVGLIHSSWGGTLAEAWTDRQALEANPDFAPILERDKPYIAEYPAALKRYEAQVAALTARGQTDKIKKLRKPQAPEDNPNIPSALYNGMIAPLQPFAIKGAIWYQGESNRGRAYQYRTLLPAMITSWRKAWGEGDFPFLIVQLPEYGKNTPEGDSQWAELREAQWLTAKNLPNVGIAVAMGLGDPANIHPLKKQEVGRRLVLVAEKQVYGKDVIDSGPAYKSMKVDGDKVEVSFDSMGGGLEAQGGKIEGFTIAGDDHKFVPADAKIESDHVVVSAPGVPHPVAVRYGWANSPTCTLYGKAGLPAAPFRTDDLAVSTVDAK